MPIDQKLWERSFAEFPSWPCPACPSGNVILDEGTLHVCETGRSKKERDLVEWEPEWIDERFFCLMICQNKHCGETVSVCGHKRHWHYSGGNEFDHWEDEGHSYTPKLLYPAPLLFRIPEECPPQLAEQLKTAFSLYWADVGSCANKIRVAVEKLLDLRNIPRAVKGRNGQSSILTTHKRIEKLIEIDADAGNLLLAIKWVGNTGSHDSLDQIELIDLYSSFDIFEYLIDEYFVKRKEQLRIVADEINARKGQPAGIREILRSRSPANS